MREETGFMRGKKKKRRGARMLSVYATSAVHHAQNAQRSSKEGGV